MVKSTSMFVETSTQNRDEFAFEFRFRACLNEKVFMMPLFLMCFASFSLAMNFKRDKSLTTKVEFISNRKYAISMKKKIVFWKNYNDKTIADTLIYYTLYLNKL